MPRKKNPNNNYFNQDVEDAVCVYLNSDDPKVREKSFRVIYPALQKIAEVWFNKLKISYTDTDMEDMMAECVAHIVEKMHMFECGKGTKAFSYFTVMAKFYYMIHNDRNYKYFKRFTPMSYMSITFDRPNTDERDGKAAESKLLLEAFTMYLSVNLENILPRKDHRMVGEYLVDLMENFEKVEEINRRKIVNQMASVSGMPSRHIITKIMNDLTAQFNLFKRRWESGDSSLNYIDKNILTEEDKKLVDTHLDIGSVKFGITRLAKRIGVSESTLRNYITQKTT